MTYNILSNMSVKFRFRVKVRIRIRVILSLSHPLTTTLDMTADQRRNGTLQERVQGFVSLCDCG